jgi:hypothetical protein
VVMIHASPLIIRALSSLVADGGKLVRLSHIPGPRVVG